MLGAIPLVREVTPSFLRMLVDMDKMPMGASPRTCVCSWSRVLHTSALDYKPRDFKANGKTRKHSLQQQQQQQQQQK
jgi:hypothetical protein